MEGFLWNYIFTKFTISINIITQGLNQYINEIIKVTPTISESHSCMIGNRMPSNYVNRTVYPSYPSAVKSIMLCIGWADYGSSYINGEKVYTEWDEKGPERCVIRNISGANSVYISSTGDDVDGCSYTFYYK